MGAVKQHVQEWVDAHTVEGGDGWYVATTNDVTDGPFEGPFDTQELAEQHAWIIAFDRGLAFTQEEG